MFKVEDALHVLEVLTAGQLNLLKTLYRSRRATISVLDLVGHPLEDINTLHKHLLISTVANAHETVEITEFGDFCFRCISETSEVGSDKSKLKPKSSTAMKKKKKSQRELNKMFRSMKLPSSQQIKVLEVLRNAKEITNVGLMSLGYSFQDIHELDSLGLVKVTNHRKFMFIRLTDLGIFYADKLNALSVEEKSPIEEKHKKSL
jgi:hypothetical protein